MAEQDKYLFVFISIVIFVHTKAPNCRDHDGNIHQIGDAWKPSDLSTCTCTGPRIDGQQNTRQRGEVWLEDPRTNCSCTQNNSVICSKLPDPVCLDASGNFRKNFETWLNGSCVECACVNGSINCTRYDVIITYGLYKVAEYPTCQQCHIPTKTAMALSSCKAFRDNRAMLTECALRGFYIRNIHRCNGIDECPDGSDEKDCGNVNCKDEEGGTFLIKDKHGWKVSKCLSCRCNAGLVTCKRTLTINFPGFFGAFYKQEDYCTQPSCKVLKFVRENRERCEGVELLKNRGILFQGQTWKSGGCSFYHPGFSWSRQCAVMTRPICYVYNGHICCASQCPALQEMKNQMRGNLTFCSNGRQLESSSLQCRGANNCLQNFYIQNCSSEVTCQDEDSNQYFEGATWSVGACMWCSCVSGKIQCSRNVVFVSFLNLTPNRYLNFTEHCYQPECNVARYMKTNKGVCNACRWNGKLYYDGDHWKENGVDFYCLTTDQRVRPGCYIENTRVNCTGAIPGIRELSLISKNGLFLCESGDEIRSLSDKCNIKQECDDASDERNCDSYYCPYEMAHGFLWNRTQVGRQVLKQCSLVNRTWTGTFGSNCTQDRDLKTFWLHDTTCYCEKKALVEYFKTKITSVNTTNLWNVSDELANSAKAKEFTNPRVFHDLYKELFFIATTRLLTPITHQNADTALQYCNSVLDTVLLSPVYSVHIFCKAKLVNDRNLLVKKALEFLRQAPNDTQAYVVGWTVHRYLVDFTILTHVIYNFGPKPRLEFEIPRKELNIQLNTAPLVPAVTEKPTVTVIPIANNVTRNNNTNSNDTRIPQKNVTNDLTNKQIKDRLRENNCTRVMFDEEKGVFLYDTGVSKEYLKHEKIQSNMELVLLCISIAAVVLALVLLTVLRLKKSERLFIHKSLLFSLGVGNLVFVLDKTSFATRQEHAALCSAVAVIQHYLSTAVFTWMLVEGINLYIKLVRVFSVKKQYIVYMLIGWGIPAVIVGLVAAIRPSTFDMSKTPTTDVTCGALKLTAEVERTRCWINGSLWIYKGPILVILVVNLVLFVILLRVIFGKIASKYANNHVTATMRGLRSIIALLPLLGVTWLVGFFVEFHYAVGYLFILLSSTQGVAFFIFHCVLDDQVQDAFRKFRDKSQLPSKTRETPAPNPNTTPILKRNLRVNILEQSVNEGTTRYLVITNKTTHAKETRL